MRPRVEARLAKVYTDSGQLALSLKHYQQAANGYKDTGHTRSDEYATTLWQYAQVAAKAQKQGLPEAPSSHQVKEMTETARKVYISLHGAGHPKVAALAAAAKEL